MLNPVERQTPVHLAEVRALVCGVTRTKPNALTEKGLSRLGELLATEATREPTSWLPPLPSRTFSRKGSLDPDGGFSEGRIFSVCLLSRQGGLLMPVN